MQLIAHDVLQLFMHLLAICPHTGFTSRFDFLFSSTHDANALSLRATICDEAEMIYRKAFFPFGFPALMHSTLERWVQSWSMELWRANESTIYGLTSDDVFNVLRGCRLWGLEYGLDGRDGELNCMKAILCNKQNLLYDFERPQYSNIA